MYVCVYKNLIEIMYNKLQKLRANVNIVKKLTKIYKISISRIHILKKFQNDISTVGHPVKVKIIYWSTFPCFVCICACHFVCICACEFIRSILICYSFPSFKSFFLIIPPPLKVVLINNKQTFYPSLFCSFNLISAQFISIVFIAFI